MSRGLLQNPIVQVTLALVVVLVIATLTFASAISGALNILRGAIYVIGMIGTLKTLNLLVCVQTAEKLRKNLVSLNCNNNRGITRISRANLGVEEDGRLTLIV